MFVACSTLCFSRKTLDASIRQIAELEFNKYELALIESGQHLRPSDVAQQFEVVLQRLRSGPGLNPSALHLDFGPVEAATLKRRFEVCCRLAKPLTIAVLAIPCAPLGTPLASEVQRLSELADIAHRDGLVLSVLTDQNTLTAQPDDAVRLCEQVPGLGLTLDPSHYINGPFQGPPPDELFEYVRNVHFRDTGSRPGEFQVRVGQGEIEYGRILSQLERVGYNQGLTVAILDELDNPFETDVEVRKLKLLLESMI